MWGRCIERIVAGERPTLRAINPKTWIKQTAYPELDFETSFARLPPSAPTSWQRCKRCRRMAGRARRP
jgi:hypothetical protein